MFIYFASATYETLVGTRVNKQTRRLKIIRNCVFFITVLNEKSRREIYRESRPRGRLMRVIEIPFRSRAKRLMNVYWFYYDWRALFFLFLRLFISFLPCADTFFITRHPAPIFNRCFRKHFGLNFF